MSGVRQRLIPPSNSHDVDNPENKYEKNGSFSNFSSHATRLKSWHFVMFGMLIISTKYLSLSYVLHLPQPKTDVHDFTEFNEARARHHLKAFTDMGYRITGTPNCEVKAVQYIMNEIDGIKKYTKPIHRIELSTDYFDGSFHLGFLSGLNHVYHGITNVAVKFSSPETSQEGSLLFNCHFDSQFETFAASDDASSCAIMLEMISVLSQSDQKLKHPLIFLFNSAEENILQASHAWITQHHWAKKVIAFVNLEACGTGGKELVFQTGPENPWLIKAYAKSTPHPFGNVFSQDIFDLGLIPGDTDFRIFRDYGKIPGIDMVYFSNGYVYHTKYDTLDRISHGTIQRSGENMLALAKYLVVEPGHLEDVQKSDKHGKVVYTDFYGIFMVVLPLRLMSIINCGLAFGVLGIVARLAVFENPKGLVLAFISVTSGVIMALIVIFLLAQFTSSLPLTTLFWFKDSRWIYPIFILPAVLSMTVCVHLGQRAMNRWVRVRSGKVNKVVIHALSFHDTCLGLFSILILTATLKDLSSATLLLPCIIFPAMGRLFFLKTDKQTPKMFMACLAACMVPLMLHCFWYHSMAIDFLVPLLGRAGPIEHADHAVGIASFVLLSPVLLYLFSLVPLAEYRDGKSKIPRFLAYCCLLFIIAFGLIVMTPLGFAFRYDHEMPKIQRSLLQHTYRRLRDPATNVVTEDSHFITYLPLTYHPTAPLREVAKWQPLIDAKPSSCPRLVPYCGLPWMLPLADMIGNGYQIAPKDPIPPHPMWQTHGHLRLLQRTAPRQHRVFYQFEYRCPTPRCALVVAPMPSTTMLRWSLTPEWPSSAPPKTDHSDWGGGLWYVLWTHGGREPQKPTKFSIEIGLLGDDWGHYDTPPAPDDVHPHRPALQIASLVHFMPTEHPPTYLHNLTKFVPEWHLFNLQAMSNFENFFF